MKNYLWRPPEKQKTQRLETQRRATQASLVLSKLLKYIHTPIYHATVAADGNSLTFFHVSANRHSCKWTALIMDTFFNYPFYCLVPIVFFITILS